MIQTQQIANVHRTSAETVEKYLFPELQKSQGLNLLQKTEIKIQILWEQLLLVLLFQLSWPYLSLELFLLTNPTKIRQIRLVLTSGKGMTMTLMKQPEENLEVKKKFSHFSFLPIQSCLGCLLSTFQFFVLKKLHYETNPENQGFEIDN